MSRDLILYATPLGELAEQCDHYFERATARGGTSAQTYPPHCTLTGFFRRTAARADEVAAWTQTFLDERRGAWSDLQVVRLRSQHDWIGLELSSPQLEQLASDYGELQQVGPGEDAIRPKSWLHLSLAYGLADLRPYERLCDLVDPTAPASWELALWERTAAGDWSRLTA